jgi:predicted RNA polymerase sigma factor
MENLIQEIKKSSNSDTVTIEELYDKYAPAVYGKIIRVIKQKDIAEKILEKVFVTALTDTNLKGVHLTPLTKLLNHTHRKTYKTLKAIKMLQACNCGYEGANPLILKADNAAKNAV